MKEFKRRELAVGWAALMHNLWVVARMAEWQRKSEKKIKSLPPVYRKCGPPDRDYPLQQEILTAIRQIWESRAQIAEKPSATGPNRIE